jgi:hypothetical protein
VEVKPRISKEVASAMDLGVSGDSPCHLKSGVLEPQDFGRYHFGEIFRPPQTSRFCPK